MSSLLARDLSFEDRVNAQEAIERVYYTHQIGVKKPFEEAFARSILEEKVRKYLKESVALERFWHTPVTAEMLQKETERMARMTRMPSRLKELFNALGKDSFLIQECLARPALVSRLARSFYWFDPSIHDAARQEAESIRAQLDRGEINPTAEHPNRLVIDFVASNQEGGPLQLQDDPMGLGVAIGVPARAELPREQFEARRSLLPSAPGVIGPVTEEPARFSIGTVLEEGEGWVRAAFYSVPKTSWDAWWDQVANVLDETRVGTAADPLWLLVELSGPPISRPQSAGEGVEAQSGATLAIQRCDHDDTWTSSAASSLPDPRTFHSAVWTGSTMIVWGGYGGNYLNTGGRYDPATDTWSPVSTFNAPTGRRLHSAVWTGSVMVVWGGSSTTILGDGGRYDPVHDRWSPISSNGAPSPRMQHVAVWTGNTMIVWGGAAAFGSSFLGDGRKYDPVLDAWTPISLVGAPSPRAAAVAVWTGAAMMVWGGAGFSLVPLSSGARYDPSSDTWSPVSTTGAPAPRFSAASAWTGSFVLVWGGYFSSAGRITYLNSGGRYDPLTDTWSAMSAVNAPSPRGSFTSVWTGAVMVVWGGYNGVASLATGGRYDPANDVWTATSTASVPLARSSHTSVWTGQLMIVWGGDGLDSGGRYDPVKDTWTPTTTSNAPEGRGGASLIWTGSFFITWGGSDDGRYLDSGGRYDPVTDNWEPISLVGAPWPRIRHTAVWSGTKMIVFGGECATTFGNCPSLGGRYDPLADAWEPMSEVNAPLLRILHTAIWTGSTMVVWGGGPGGSILATGGRYDPVNDSWEQTSTIDAPAARNQHTAVWTGSEMLIWGGVVLSGPNFTAVNTGGRYDPIADRWSSLQAANAPAGRRLHKSVWTGREMMVWGGEWRGTHFTTGGLYDPSLDSWRPTSTTSSPSGRVRNSMVWTGKWMVIWGGDVLNTGIVLDTGARYDPSTDTWSAIMPTSVPLSRSDHISAWSGDAMFVWGGYNGSYTRSGAYYCACEEVLQYRDADQDGYGDEGSSIFACEGRLGYVARGGDCNDNDPGVHLGAAERCDGADDNCNGAVDEGFNVGAPCTEKMDECHQVIGNRVCAPDGAASVCAGVVHLQDLTPPIISCPTEAVLECPANGANVGPATALDECDPGPRVISDAPAVLPLGGSVLNWTATDASGNSTSCQQPVQVRDTIPPSLTLSLSPTTLWPPNHRMVPVQATWQVSDACDPTANAMLVSVVSSEGDDLPGNGDGSTTHDIQDASPGTSDTSVLLRAERSGNGPGRIYTLTYMTRDASGNTSSDLGLVSVPHDLGSGPEPLQVNLEPYGTSGLAHLYWNEVPETLMYDLIQGNLDQVTAQQGMLWLGPVRVLASGMRGTSYTETSSSAIPAVGRAFFYLVQYWDAKSESGWGTESSSWPAKPTSCDTECPGDVSGT